MSCIVSPKIWSLFPIPAYGCRASQSSIKSEQNLPIFQWFFFLLTILMNLNWQSCQATFLKGWLKLWEAHKQDQCPGGFGIYVWGKDLTPLGFWVTRNWQEASCLFAIKVVLDLDHESSSNKTPFKKALTHSKCIDKISGGSRIPQSLSTDPLGVHKLHVVSYYFVSTQVSLISPLHLYSRHLTHSQFLYTARVTAILLNSKSVLASMPSGWPSSCAPKGCC